MFLTETDITHTQNNMDRVQNIYRAIVDEHLKLVFIKIGDPYRLYKALVHQGLHSTPSFSEVRLSVVDKL